MWGLDVSDEVVSPVYVYNFKERLNNAYVFIVFL